VHPWHNMFLCAAMTETDIDQALNAAEDSFAELKRQAPNLAPSRKWPSWLQPAFADPY